jgi:hypothetical protein
VRRDIAGIDFHRDALPDQIYRQHEAGLLSVLPKEPSNDAPQRTVSDLDHHALSDHRTGVVRQRTAEMADVETLVKNNPGPSLLGAAVIGFLAGRAFSNND